MSFALDAPTGVNTDPNKSLGDFRGTRYPNQFFDLSQQYMPPTIKELFRWCTFYFYNSPLIGAAIKKVSRYPITDLIIEDQHDSIRGMWQKILVKTLKMKERLMEINLDYHAYGNAFVSLHFPFVRFLICKNCKHRQPIKQWSWSFSMSQFSYSGTCSKCGHNGSVDVKDVSYKDYKAVKIIRWNPENIQIKFNEYTGRYIYMYAVPAKLRNAIMRGDKDILEDIPLIVIDAIRKRRMIRFSEDNLFHLKAPTLAEQDQGWGKPLILHVLKDMYYFYTLRRAQEAIALEHIVPFDMIYPLPNAQQDPYIHTDMASWRIRIEDTIRRHRRDPNYKAVIPIPVGFGRLGGDGKALLLSPELNYLTQTVVGGLGLPQEFLFGGLNWTGSSVSLRTLENDFIQNRTQLLDLVDWFMDKLSVWMTLPKCDSVRFADFRMADDIQRNQQLIGLNAQGKVSDQTLLTELGYDYDQETRKRIEEIYVANYLADLQTKGNAKTQGEAQIVQFNYQQRIQELAQKAQEEAEKRLRAGVGGREAMVDEAVQANQLLLPANQWQDPAAQSAAQQQQQQQQQGPQPSGGVQGSEFQTPAQQIDAKIESWARQLSSMDPNQARMTLTDLKARMPDIGSKIEAAYNMMMAQSGGQAPGQAVSTDVNMTPMPEQKPPRRAGGV